MSDDASLSLFGARLDHLVSLVQDLIAKHAETDARVERVERVLEQRLYDTRPIWQTVQAQLLEIGERYQSLESRIDDLRTEMQTESSELRTQMTELRAETTEMRVENSNAFRLVDRKIGVLGKPLIDMTANITELQDRVEKIESRPTRE